VLRSGDYFDGACLGCFCCYWEPNKLTVDGSIVTPHRFFILRTRLPKATIDRTNWYVLIHFVGLVVKDDNYSKPNLNDFIEKILTCGCRSSLMSLKQTDELLMMEATPGGRRSIRMTVRLPFWCACRDRHRLVLFCTVLTKVSNDLVRCISRYQRCVTFL
jgi:hypothetical protein